MSETAPKDLSSRLAELMADLVKHAMDVLRSERDSFLPKEYAVGTKYRRESAGSHGIWVTTRVMCGDVSVMKETRLPSQIVVEKGPTPAALHEMATDLVFEFSRQLQARAHTAS